MKPELLTSVLEIATPPCADINEAGAELAELRQMMVELAAERNLLVGAAGTHPFARWEDQAIVDRPRYRELVEQPRLHRQARADLRHPRPRGDRGRRPRHLRRRRDQALPAAAPGPVDELAVLARPHDRDDVRAGPGLPLVPARGHPAALRHLGDLLPPGRPDDPRRGDRGLHLHVVGRAAPSEARHRRDADLRPADEPRVTRSRWRR